MIRITTVLGDVLVDDRKTGRSQMARSGMTLDPMGDYLIATMATSHAVITLNGQGIKLEPSSYLRICGDRCHGGPHHEPLWERFLGRLWAQVDRNPRDPNAGVQGGGGVRG